MKRWGKSPPLQAQARRHGKPHRVQGQIGDRGAARSMPRVGQASRLSREEETGWKSVPLCGQVPGTGCSDKWFSPSRKGRRQNSAYSPSKINESARLRIGASFRTGLFVQSRFTTVGGSQFLAIPGCPAGEFLVWSERAGRCGTPVPLAAHNAPCKKLGCAPQSLAPNCGLQRLSAGLT